MRIAPLLVNSKIDTTTVESVDDAKTNRRVNYRTDVNIDARLAECRRHRQKKAIAEQARKAVAAGLPDMTSAVFPSAAAT